ncbi:MAG TPA: c-type cytochrome [Gemmatales bacterium]|nr:c-type cytochrome [Gemmatales bacterium]
MGLLVDGGYLYFMGDGGLRRMPWTPGQFSAKSDLLIPLKTGGEHDAHAISRGPDGWLYLLCGNMSDVANKIKPAASSSIKKLTAGCVLRVSPDFTTIEILCDGFRNAYGFDWSLDGELFTYDSDNERCLGLPWYEGCRFYRIEGGGHYGWRSPQKAQFWRQPPYHPKIVAPLLDLGRGSPTGVVCYRHQQFPKEYQGTFFLLDWTFGIIHNVKISEDKATASAFLKVAPGHGFAPTAAAIHPNTGDLYISTGGRGTRGAVYRIRHEQGYKTLPAHAQSQAPRLTSSSRTLAGSSEIVVPNRQGLLRQFREDTTSLMKMQLLCYLIADLGEIGTTSSDYAFKEGYQLTLNQDLPVKQAFLQEILKELRTAFPSKDAALNREISRAMALLKDDASESLTKLLSQITPNSSSIDDIHYLFVIACCTAPRTAEQREAITQALVQLDAKYEREKLPRERNWALRLSEAVRALIDLDPALLAAITKHPDLGRPDHLHLVHDKRFPRAELAMLWLKRLQADKEYPWSNELVSLLRHGSNADILPLLRSHWEETTLQDAILPVLAKANEEQDRQRFISALRSTSRNSVTLALEALASLPTNERKTLTEELVNCVKALRYWSPVDAKVAALFQKHLSSLAQSKATRSDKEWQEWLITTHPEIRQQLEDSDGVDRAKWDARLKKIEWTSGRMPQGELVYKQLCASCHQGTSALGPDLAGVGKRFSHDDLIAAILQPSKDVPVRYRTSIFTTHSGQTHVGLVIYEAVDGVILQSASATIRIPGNDIAAQRSSDQSLMPAGLLDALTDEQIADLLAWLKR